MEPPVGSQFTAVIDLRRNNAAYVITALNTNSKLHFFGYTSTIRTVGGLDFF
jgi:hypothetical protein